MTDRADVVVVVGGAIAGSPVATFLAARGVRFIERTSRGAPPACWLFDLSNAGEREPHPGVRLVRVGVRFIEHSAPGATLP